MTRVPLLVCGTPLRGDDGAALAAVERLSGSTIDLADLHFVGQLEADLLLAPGMEPCVVVDTVVGVPPGSVVSLALDAVADVGIARIPHSSHSLGIGRAVRLAETVLGRPFRGWFVGIGGADFRVDAQLSDAVREALPALSAAVSVAVAEMAAAGMAVAGMRVAEMPVAEMPVAGMAVAEMPVAEMAVAEMAVAEA